MSWQHNKLFSALNAFLVYVSIENTTACMVVAELFNILNFDHTSLPCHDLFEQFCTNLPMGNPQHGWVVGNRLCKPIHVIVLYPQLPESITNMSWLIRAIPSHSECLCHWEIPLHVYLLPRLLHSLSLVARRTFSWVFSVVSQRHEGVIHGLSQWVMLWLLGMTTSGLSSTVLNTHSQDQFAHKKCLFI